MGGHTEITAVVNQPVISVCGVGKVKDGCVISTGGAKPGMDIREQVFASCVNHGFVILQMNPVSKSLEDVFLELTEKEGTQKEVLPEKKLHFVKSHFGKESKEDGE